MYAQYSSTALFVLSWGIVVLLIWTLHRQWWRLRSVRDALWIVPSVVLPLIVLWSGLTRHRSAAAGVVAIVCTMLVTMSTGLAITLPFSGVALTLERFVRWIGDRVRRQRRSHATELAANRDEGLDPRRRSIIVAAAAALPALGLVAAGGGVIASGTRTRFPVVPMYWPDLPADLDGLRILHVSDIHLGYFVNLEDLERTMSEAAGQKPDLVLVTGDVSDDLRVLPDALRLLAQLHPRLGTWASIGNHEYYRGIGAIRRTFDAGPIPLMIDKGTDLRAGATRIHLTAADDPAHTGRFNDPVFLRRSVDRALDGAPSNEFIILMSHRPEGFDIAARDGVHLTLSGHYHGGIQIGWNGRAIIQPLRPEVHYWGHYRKGNSQLYTSGGVGHWVPFRLNCPPEAPVIVLRRG